MPVLAAAHGHSARRGEGTVPSLRASATATVNSGSSVTITIPAAAQVDDVALFFVNTGSTMGAFTIPAGLTSLCPGMSHSGNGSRVNAYARKIVAGDAGSTVTFTSTTTGQIQCVCCVYQDAEGVGVAAVTGHDKIDPTADNGTHPRIPAIKCGPQDLIVTFGGARAYASTSLNFPKITSPGTGMTLRAQAQSQANALQFAYGVWACDGPATRSMQTIVPTTGGQCYNVAGALALTPKGHRPTCKVPASLSNAAIHGYGTSYLTLVAPVPDSSFQGFYSKAMFYERIANQLGTPVEDNCMGMQGATSSDISGFAFGNVVYATRAASGSSEAVNQAGTWLSMVHRSGLVICDPFGNDALQHASTANGATTAKALASARTAGEALIRLLRADSIVGDDDAGMTYTGTWTTATANDVAGGSNRYTTTPGAKVSFSTSEVDIDVLLMAIDDANFANAGADYEVRVDGTLVASGSTGDQMKQSPAAYNKAAYCHKTVALHGLAAGTKTIEVKHAGASGEALFFDGYLIPAVTPPWIVLNAPPYELSSSLYATSGIASSDADMELYADIAKDIGALFDDGRVIVFDPIASGEWDYTTMINTTDYAHPTDQGSAHYAYGILKLLSERVA